MFVQLSKYYVPQIKNIARYWCQKIFNKMTSSVENVPNAK